MKPVLQTKFATPASDREGGEHLGNCMQASVASILELPLEDVPHFAAFAEDWWPKLRDWLDERGFMLVVAEPELQQRGFCLAIGQSPRGPYNHVVVFEDGELAHDPNPAGGGLAEVSELWLLVAKNPARLQLDAGESPAWV